MIKRLLFCFSVAIFFAVPAYAETIDQAVLSYNPLAYWRFETIDPTADTSGNGNTLTLDPNALTGVSAAVKLGSAIRTNDGGAVTAAPNAALTPDTNYHWVAWIKKTSGDSLTEAGVIGGHASDGGTSWDPNNPGPNTPTPLAREGQRMQWNGNQRIIHVINGNVSDPGAENSRDLHFDINDFSQPADQRFEPVSNQLYMVSVSSKDNPDPNGDPLLISGDIFWEDPNGISHQVSRTHTVPATQLPVPPTTDTFSIGRHESDGGIFSSVQFPFAGMIDEFAIFDGMLMQNDLERIFAAGVPEPTTLILLSMAGMGLATIRRRTRM